MFLNYRKETPTVRPKGSALVIAIFIIVVMTLLGTALVRMLSTSAETIVYEVLGTRAYNAAQIGLQWQLQQVFPLNNTAQLCSGTVPDLKNTEGLENCKVSVQCDDSLIVDTRRFYTIKSTGQCEVADVITSRTLEVIAKSL
ncbi:pilus assembly PilX N-terminal domain-containing protein [Colwelliaceae bacterium 6441]